MKRREFIQLALAPLAAVVRPRLASAQARTPRIGLLALGSSATTAEFVQELKAGLREHGLVDGENVRLELAFGETHQALDDLAVQLVRSNVSLVPGAPRLLLPPSALQARSRS
jgi:putative tryptophan/tyrosine transport system substrate-binding protein